MSEVVIEIEMPEDCIKVGTIGIAQWMDADGEMNFALNIEGDLTYLGLVGLMEMAKLRLVSEWELLQEDED